MPAPPIRSDATALDLSPRFVYTTTVAGSPATNEEKVIATLPTIGNLSLQSAVWLEGYCSVTIGTSGATATLRIRQTNTSGTVIATTGAITVTATQIYALAAQGQDTAATLPGQVYVLTLQIGSGAASSTVGSVSFQAQVV